jgi:dienelactone hydrolase
MKPLLSALLALAVVAPCYSQDAPQAPKDARLGKPIDYNGRYAPDDPKKPLPFTWTAPASKEEWARRRPQVHTQMLVANGLWPLPEKTPLNPTIHGKIERDGYTIEKVFFASYPGHYVTGNLYRPAGGQPGKKHPGVLFAHGHWTDARLSEFSDKAAEAELKSGAEKTRESAKYIFQALSQQLARMGCVVFHYDMVGNADSRQIPHRQGFLDVDAELRLQSFMGLQTWNSVRSLDFLVSLPDVDASRIGMTGASGGGTQTFVLAALDDRVTVAFPAVMVSLGMQGGCICENASYLRVGTNNIEMSGLIAPRPLAMSGANDWTKHIETEGLPQLKALYKLYSAEENVDAKAWLQFGHNYNQVAREYMYSWFNRHLKLDQKEPIAEQPFVPVPPKELSVYDAKHPLPNDAVDAAGLRAYLTKESDEVLDKLTPKDAASLKQFRQIIGGALESMIADRLPSPANVEVVAQDEGKEIGKVKIRTFVLSRKGQGEAVRALGMLPVDCSGEGIIWVHPNGIASVFKDGAITPDAQTALDAGAAILAVEPLRTGATADAPKHPVNKNFAGYTFGYNRPLLADRVHDILTAVATLQKNGVKRIHLAGFGNAGPWVALARGLCGDAVARTAVDLNQFSFKSVKSYDDEMMLPGALRYGDLGTLAALAAPHELLAYNAESAGKNDVLAAAYAAGGNSSQLRRQPKALRTDAVIEWLLRR